MKKYIISVAHPFGSVGRIIIKAPSDNAAWKAARSWAIWLAQLDYPDTVIYVSVYCFSASAEGNEGKYVGGHDLVVLKHSSKEPPEPLK